MFIRDLKSNLWTTKLPTDFECILILHIVNVDLRFASPIVLSAVWFIADLSPEVYSKGVKVPSKMYFQVKDLFNERTLQFTGSY